MVNHIINECSKLTQNEFKTWLEWVGKGIHWELCKKFKFDHTNKWYMHKPDSLQEKGLWDFEIQTDHQNPGQKTKPSFKEDKKEKMWILLFQRIVQCNKRKRNHKQIVKLCLRAEKAVEHESDGDTYKSW